MMDLLESLFDLLLDRWLTLCKRIGASDNSTAFFTTLFKTYREPHRSYHNLGHILECLAELDQARHLARNPDTIEFAIWYHDAIYDLRANDNEERSAQVAEMAAKNMGLSDSFTETVKQLILATKHTGIGFDEDSRLIADIYLAIFGQPEERFDEYEQLIRAEYDWVAEVKYLAERINILRGFLKPIPIYSTRFFYDKYEEPARKNIQKLIARLREKQKQLREVENEAKSTNSGRR